VQARREAARRKAAQPLFAVRPFGQLPALASLIMKASLEKPALQTSEEGYGLPSLSDVMENLGMGVTQFRFGILGGCMWMADGSELLLVGGVTRAVSHEWHLRAWQRGAIVSIVFVGILVGNALSGPLGDSTGRRLPILLSYAGVALFGACSALTYGFLTLSAVRLMVGLSIGIGQPSFGALCSEITPARWRILMNSGAQVLFVTGEIYAIGLIYLEDPYMRDLNWRRLFILSAIPAAFFGLLAFFFLQQSPSWLSVQGRQDEARRVLEHMRLENGAHHVSVEFKPSRPVVRGSSLWEAYMRPVRLIYSPRMFYSTVAVIYSCFTLNVVFYGCLYAFPQVVPTLKMGHTPATTLLVGALWEFPGFMMAIICGMYLARKPAMTAYLLLTCSSLVAFTLGASAGDVEHWAPYSLLHGGYIGIKCFACIGFVCVYQYSTEIYPTEARTTGTAACVAGGRMGGILAPILFEKIMDITGSFEDFFYCIAVLCAMNLILVFFLPFETYGKKLDDELSPLTKYTSPPVCINTPRNVSVPHTASGSERQMPPTSAPPAG